MENPKFSIVVPVYNAEGYLHQCLDSLLRQGLDNYEILLVNDGSTDSSLSICKEYANDNSNIKILNQSNQGVCSARNNGLEHVTGEWVILVDSDDYLLDNGLYTAFSAVEKQEDYDIIQYKSSYDFWPKRALTSDVTFKGEGLDLIRESGFVSFCWLCFYRRDFLNDNHIRFNSKYIVGVSTDITMRNKDYMSKLLVSMLENSKKKSMPFVFLTPINPKIYRKFSFEYFSNIEYYNFSVIV